MDIVTHKKSGPYIEETTIRWGDPRNAESFEEILDIIAKNGYNVPDNRDDEVADLESQLEETEDRVYSLESQVEVVEHLRDEAVDAKNRLLERVTEWLRTVELEKTLDLNELHQICEDAKHGC